LDNEEEKKQDLKVLDTLFEEAKKTDEYVDLFKHISPFVGTLRDSDRAKKFLKECMPTLLESLEMSQRRMELFKGYSKAVGKEPVIILGKLFVYLGLFETSLKDSLDMIMLMLMSIGHDFYVERIRSYAQTIKDLDRADLSEKRVFLDLHGFQIISEKKGNLNWLLRNKIAHMDFEIKPDGKISVAGREFDVEHELVKLMRVIAIMWGALKESGFLRILGELGLTVRNP
jgi:hypothetical protein